MRYLRNIVDFDDKINIRLALVVSVGFHVKRIIYSVS